MKFFARKVIKLRGADLHLHYANNKGRGDSNVTVTVVKTGTEREVRSDYYTEYFRQYKTAGWRGVVNIGANILDAHGGLVDEEKEMCK